MADVLIAGAGIAGTTIAILLGRAGFKVMLFERDSATHSKAHGGAIMPAGMHMLQRHQLHHLAGQSFQGIRYYQQNTLLAEGSFPSINKQTQFGQCYQRWQIDHMLRGVAQTTPNVQICYDSLVESPIWHSNHICGLIVNQQAYYAPLTIIADGLNSPLRRMLGLSYVAKKRDRFAVHALYKLRADQELSHWIDIYLGQGYVLQATPLPEHSLAICAASYQDTTEPFDTMLNYNIQQHPFLVQQLAGAQQIEPIECSPPFGQYARQGVFPGGLLLGDAANFSDPITGGGITQALLTAELLASILWHRQQLHYQEWLQAFEQQRRTLLRDHHFLTHSMQFLNQHPLLLQITLRLLHRSPGLLSHLVAVIANLRRLNGFYVSPPSVPATKPPH